MGKNAQQQVTDFIWGIVQVLPTLIVIINTHRDNIVGQV